MKKLNDTVTKHICVKTAQINQSNNIPPSLPKKKRNKKITLYLTYKISNSYIIFCGIREVEI